MRALACSVLLYGAGNKTHNTWGHTFVHAQGSEPHSAASSCQLHGEYLCIIKLLGWVTLHNQLPKVRTVYTKVQAARQAYSCILLHEVTALSVTSNAQSVNQLIEQASNARA
jgi:prephenate dehydratase